MDKNNKIICDLAERLHAINSRSIGKAIKSFVKTASDWELRFCNVNELQQNTNDNQVIGYFNNNELVCGLNMLTSTWEHIESDINIVYCTIAQIRYNKHEDFRLFRLAKNSEIYQIATEIVKQFYDLNFDELVNA